MIYKLCSANEWREAEQTGVYGGSAVDSRDGFIHFSTAAQLAETARKHFSGQQDLVLVSIDEMKLGDALKWEPSRGGDLFPHLYSNLPTTAATQVQAIVTGPDGFPVILPAIK
jgi:uncharacterized protein (DUF952 family)